MKMMFVCIAIVCVCVWRMVAGLARLLRSLSNARVGID